MKSARNAAVLAFMLVLTLIPMGAHAVGDVFVSEIHYDNTGADTGEAIEVTAPAAMDMAGWSLVLYNGSATQLKPYNTVDLIGTVPSEGAFTISFPSNGIQNGSPDGWALVDPGGTVTEFHSYEGTFVPLEGPATGLTSVDIGVAESSSTLIGDSLQLVEGSWTGPAASNFAPPLIAPEPEPEFRLIHEVQGSGFTSPLLGDRVIVEGIVVGDFEEEDGERYLRGFHVQEEDADADADATTSEGIFVFNFNNDDVAVGDLVSVEGTAEEFSGNTQLGNFVEVTVLSSGNALPTAAIVDFPIAASSDLEAVEGMHATFPDSLAIIEYFNYDRFGEVVVGLPLDGEDRHNQATSVYDTGTPEAAELAAYNALNRITIDDKRTGQNPEFSIHPGNGEEFTLTNTFRGGDTITGITGAIHSSFGLYRIMPTVYGDYVNTNVRQAAPDDVGGSVTVASFNALNYFLTVDRGGSAFNVCGPNQDQDCRGADSDEELERQRAKLLAALVGLDADIVGLVELENTPGVEALADIVDGLNDILGKKTYSYVAAGENSIVGPDTIKVGFIYKRGEVQAIGETAILDDPSFLDPNNTGVNRNRAALAQTFVEKGTGERVTVVVNHLKSKGSGCGAGDDDPEAGSCNLTRTLAAQALVDWLGTHPTTVDDPDYLIVGDLNSYDEEDPIDALVAAGYTDLVKEVEGELAYSFVFSGQFGYLDYAMSNASLTPQISGVTTWHINSDEADLLDYNTSFRGPVQQGIYAPDAFRSSDHDPVLIGLDLDRKLSTQTGD